METIAPIGSMGCSISDLEYKKGLPLDLISFRDEKALRAKHLKTSPFAPKRPIIPFR
jgi:hypothetical protein